MVKAKLTKATKKEIKKQVKKEISSRICTLLSASIFSVVLFFLWKAFIIKMDPESTSFLYIIGALVVIVILAILSIVNMVLWIAPFTKDGLDVE